MLNTPAVVNRPSTTRSQITNRKRLHHGVDGRSAEARRFRDLVMTFAKPLGGFAALSDEDAALCREAAALTVDSERRQAAIVRGESVDPAAMVRGANALGRIMGMLEARRKAATTAPSVDQYLANRARRPA